MAAKKWTGLMLAVLLGTGVVFAEAQQGNTSKDAQQMRERLQQALRAERSGNATAREQMAAQQDDTSKTDAQRGRLQRATPAGRGMELAGREQMFRDRMAQQAEKHSAEIKQLMDIKKLAEEEKATKTAEAIQKLIDEKNAVYQKNIEQVERARRERAARLQQRTQQVQSQKQKGQSKKDGSGTDTKTAGETDKD